MSESLSANPLFAEGSDALVQLQQASENPIVVKFVAPHCPSCNTLAPVLTQIVTDRASVHLVTIDITEDPELAMELEVRSVPTVVVFKGTTVLERIIGLQPKKLYLEAIEKTGFLG
jgi:thioredoxin 1